MPDDLEQQLAHAWTTVDAFPAYTSSTSCPACGNTFITDGHRLTPLEAAALSGAPAAGHRWLIYPVICRHCPCGHHWHQKPADHDQHKPAGATPTRPKRARAITPDPVTT